MLRTLHPTMSQGVVIAVDYCINRRNHGNTISAACYRRILREALMKYFGRFALCVMTLLFSHTGVAQQSASWPVKPIRFVVAFAPGGPADVIARLVGNKLTDALGQQVIVENRGGAGGNIAAGLVAKAVPDGYTAMVTTSAFAVNLSLYANPGYEERDFIPVVNVATQPNLIFVNAAFPAKTLAELLAMVKSGKMAFASPGLGTTPHLTGENLFRVIAKADVTPIHFSGAGPAVTALVTGEPPIASLAPTAALPHVRSGKLRAIAVAGATRFFALPEVPTFAEAGVPGVQDYTWTAFFLPAGTPVAVVQRLNESTNRIIQMPDIRERLNAQGLEPVGGASQQFADYVKTEIAKWGKVVREAGMKAE
ncbi:MAG: tripartite tricarboxylate transporter substrate binding protein [Betaproteobacteria bacterium]|nr:tripartite tricarboxylate transporter substrate binding protein [Betaproteobacteria bacterium]